MTDSSIQPVTNITVKEIAPEIDIFAKKHIRYDYVASTNKIIIPSIKNMYSGPVVFTIHASIYDFTLPCIVADFQYRLIDRDGQLLQPNAMVAPIDLSKFPFSDYEKTNLQL
jgi:hypothetical protein